MAALQLASAVPKAFSFDIMSFAPRLLTPYIRPSWSMPCEQSSSTALQLPSPAFDSPSSSAPSHTSSSGWLSLIPSLESLLELLPPILLAAPKKKTSHRKKMQKLAGTGLKNRTNLKSCPACGSIQLLHHLCPNCFGSINKAWKEERRRIVPRDEPSQV